MTTYGTIPSEPTATSNLLFASQAKEWIQTGLATRRPWKEMIYHFQFPTSFLDTIQRIKINAELFRMNYTVIMLFTLFLSLLWHPISLIVFIVMMAAWLFLYFLRDEPLVVFGYMIDERVVMLTLLLVTIGLLFLTEVTDNVIAGLSIGLVVVLAHAVLRDTQDLFSVDQEAGGVVKVPLKHAASSSFTLS
ncbi:PRA1 family protein [Quillaja saponaria]|uniref:PRA1 family protein n=1 Tax=Quillaja saponaria TaxID=32244 RepID=A0AAD7M656_QUISA|nr:PRA1 family protein [Quillaja saponaria]